ncbi:recombinase family protein [uncultured Nocardioides sp.]|uniref:recombinase family protein n=1 Tax=uncultured Nocardioides sp. TaxID=198441 RepID=UPI002622CBAE|nr:recombinase family protein [uncultured Nocardioides sp.]
MTTTATAQDTVRAVVYARISLDRRGDEAGVDRQMDAAHHAIANRGWVVAGEPYVDNDVSAFSGATRPGYARLMRDVTAGRVDVVVVFQTSRLWRNRRERAEGIELLRAHGVSVVATKGPSLDMSSAYGRGMAGLLGEFDTMESEVKGERVMAALQQNAQLGRSHGRATYGWDRTYDATTGRSRDVLNAAEADVIRDIADRILRGDSINAITRELNERGVVSPADAKRPAEKRRGTPWGKQMVRAVVTRDRNAGLRVHQGEVLGEGAWEPTLDRGTWERVCAVLADPVRRTSTGSAAKHLLSGIAVCDVCDGPMRAATNRDVPSYKCAEKSHVTRNRRDADAYVNAVVVARLSQRDAVDLLAPRDLAHLEAAAEARALEQRLDTAADDYADGKITARQLERITARLRPQVDDALARARTVDDTPLLTGLVGAPDVAAAWEALPLTRRRAVVDLLLTVRIGRAQQGARVFDPATVKLAWR